MADAISSALAAGTAAATVSAVGTTMAPGVIMAARWMSSISLSRTSAQRAAT
jgi:hypothetical protein